MYVCMYVCICICIYVLDSSNFIIYACSHICKLTTYIQQHDCKSMYIFGENTYTT